MLYILMGKSACGKDTILNELVKYNFIPLVSNTTRPIRDGEINGKDYFFINNKKFKEMEKNGELLEFRVHHTILNNTKADWYYGLSKQNLDKDKNYVVITDVDGCKSLLKHYGEDNCKVFYIYLDDKTRTQRASQRGGFCPIEWERRLVTDRVDFSEINMLGIDYTLYYNKYDVDYIVKLILGGE